MGVTLLLRWRWYCLCWDGLARSLYRPGYLSGSGNRYGRLQLNCIRVNYPFFGGDKAEGRWQMAEEKKDFSRKGGYQGGFGMTPLLLFPGKNHDFRRGEAFLPPSWYEA